MSSTQTVFDRQYNLYRQWGADNRYEIDSGRFDIPLALSDAEIDDGENPVVVVQAYAAKAKRKMTFTVNKAEGPPVLPAPADAGQFAFLNGSLDFWPTANQSGNGMNWEVSGYYEFVQACRFDYTDGFVLNGYPFPLAVQEGSINSGAPGPNTGPLVGAGADAIFGYNVAQSLDLTNEFWQYVCPTYFPGQLFDPAITVGGLPPVQ